MGLPWFDPQVARKMFFSGVAADVRSFVQTVTINHQTLPSTPQYVSERELVPVQYMSNLGAQDNVKPDIFNKTKETILKYFLIFFIQIYTHD